MSTTVDNPFVVCSLVLRSVEDTESVLRQLFSLLRPGGELRYRRRAEDAIVAAGFGIAQARREWAIPPWAPLPVAELALGRAVRPAA